MSFQQWSVTSESPVGDSRRPFANFGEAAAIRFAKLSVTAGLGGSNIAVKVLRRLG